MSEKKDFSKPAWFGAMVLSAGVGVAMSHGLANDTLQLIDFTCTRNGSCAATFVAYDKDGKALPDRVVIVGGKNAVPKDRLPSEVAACVSAWQSGKFNALGALAK